MVEGGLSGLVDGVSLAKVHLIRRHQADAGMVMVAVVPFEEVAAETYGVFNAAETLWKLRLVFQGLEVALREGIVIRGVGC